MSKIYLYAELLLHIRQVTLFAILPSNCDQSTRLDLCPDNRTIHVTHNGELATIELPCAVLANKKLQIPSSPGLELSFRLAVGAHVGLTAQVQQGNDVYGPWSASMLTAETLISCQSCGRLLTKDVTTWKDLPSEGWAEMMDFWHCHKPSVQHESDPQAGSKKGYASSNALRPTKGIGLVDVLHLWISESNYVGFNITDGQELILCPSCLEPIGVAGGQDISARLYKWSLALQRSQSLDWETCSVQDIISAQFLALIEDQATYKFLAYSRELPASETSLLLWVFTPDLMYSTSAKTTQRAMKVFYHTVTDPSQILEGQSNKIEELRLPNYALQTLHADLKQSSNILPKSARTHREWSIGLLDRWLPLS